ncbi:hypothetical protein [Bacillus subtilis]|uniref:Uncharacterized protein n=1 Tax=Bacillus subtilis TaxID=1423 RepID=A0A8I1WGB1_BACIU|nr:hypothetical protein [Bacillus subtilis]KAF2421611.1 hypothetical protein B6K89_20665 [Bacillus subtilis]MBO3794182.1 hypothetical protein [Bacillus subtilis]
MPVFNPKTNENDFVDLSLVDKIAIDPEFLTDMLTDKKFKVELSLSADQESEEVILHAKKNDVELENVRIILQDFEEMLFNALNNVKSQRLEDDKEFKSRVQQLINTYIKKSSKDNNHYAMTGLDYVLDKGIGIIRDTKTNQEVGTFESVTYLYPGNSYPNLLTVKDITLYGRTMEELQQSDRYEFAYYSLDCQYIYSFMSTDHSNIEITNNNLSINKFQLVTDAFGSTHSYFQTVKEAQEQKLKLGSNNDSDDILSELESDKFRASRLAILEASKAKQKQAQLEKQFSDIEFDF